jgi:uncharacterized membrane protein
MKRIGFLLIFLGVWLSVFQPARAQSDSPLVLVMTADGPIMPQFAKTGLTFKQAEKIKRKISEPQGELGI